MIDSNDGALRLLEIYACIMFYVRRRQLQLLSSTPSVSNDRIKIYHYCCYSHFFYLFSLHYLYCVIAAANFLGNGKDPLITPLILYDIHQSKIIIILSFRLQIHTYDRGFFYQNNT